MRGFGFVNPCESAAPKFHASVKVTTPLVGKIESQDQALPNLNDTKALQARACKDKDERLQKKLEDAQSSLLERTRRAAKLAAEKGASSRLTRQG